MKLNQASEKKRFCNECKYSRYCTRRPGKPCDKWTRKSRKQQQLEDRINNSESILNDGDAGRFYTWNTLCKIDKTVKRLKKDLDNLEIKDGITTGN